MARAEDRETGKSNLDLIARAFADAERWGPEPTAGPEPSTNPFAILGTPGERIGPYTLRERIGEGGFGEVWAAEQAQPIHRKVALKVIKLGMDTRHVIARFEAERQALAMMDHPNIARVFDAGATDSGRPYFVMELVRGVPVARFCDEHQLTVRQRLELFVELCHAVQHAHTKGIIHRDLKPSNVLVSRHDDRPVVKVIDFGLAKATGGPLTDKTVYTEWRQLLGTPAYMSPEQAGMSDLDVDTRSDVYSLGVLLYELLTGTLPFGAKQLLGIGYDELRRMIREVEPERPSTRIGTLFSEPRPLGSGASPSDETNAKPLPHGRGSEQPSSALDIAKRRRTDPQSLARMIRGDLDWIVMKCLEKDRTRRYETANGLAADVDRYLDGEPVLAAPPSRLYRLRKQLRRHRLPVAVVGGFVALIAGGLVVSLTLWRGASAARDAESGQRARAAAVSAFLTEMLTAADPAKAKGEKLTVREALDAAAKRIEERPIQDQPLVEADVRFTIGSTYFGLGLYPQAEAQLRAADALQSRELGDEHPDTLRTRCKLADTLVGKSDYAGAAIVAQPTMEAQSRVLGPDHPDTLQSMAILGSVLSGQVGRFAEGESLLRSAIERREQVLGQNHPDTAHAMNRLGEAYTHNTYPDKAEPLHREALRIHTQALGEEHPATLHSMGLLALSLNNQSRPEEAEAIYRRVLELRLRVLGPEHMYTLATQGMLAASLNGQGRYAEAETMYRESLAALLRTVGPTHFNTINNQRFLANCLVRQRNYLEAETLLREALDAAREKYGPEDAESIRLICALASLLAQQRKDPEAEQVARQVIEFQHRQRPRAHPGELAESSSALIQVLQRRGANDEALRVEQELIESWLAAAHQPDASAQMLNRAALALLYPANEKLRDASQALELALQANERSDEQNPRHLRTLALAYFRTGDTPKAIKFQKQALDLVPQDSSQRPDYEARLAEFEAALEKPDGKDRKP